MKTLREVLENKVNGLYYGNRIILPFKVYFLKVIIEKDVITDFSKSSKGINIIEHDDFMELYFLDYKNLDDVISEYESIKMVVVEKGKDVFDFKNHVKLNIYIQEHHKITVEETDSDILFIE
jgi:ribosomal protein S18